MAKLTNAQLLSELEAARIEIQRLTAEVSSLKSRAPARDFNDKRRVSTHVRNPAAEAAHTAYMTALMAAKEEAMRTGRTVVFQRPV